MNLVVMWVDKKTVCESYRGPPIGSQDNEWNDLHTPREKAMWFPGDALMLLYQQYQNFLFFLVFLDLSVIKKSFLNKCLVLTWYT